MNRPDVDYRDIQGLLRFGYGKLPEAKYALLQVHDVAAARRWLLEAPIATAEMSAAPPFAALQVAVTAAGLEALGVPTAVRQQFPQEFLEGMADEHRARRLGDVGDNAPARWVWGAAWQPHLLVMFYARQGELASLIEKTTRGIWRQAFAPPQWLETSQLDGIEPFGFADGISQPTLDWQGTRDGRRAGREYGGPTALGEFVLGYPNEYDRYTARPLLASDSTSADLLPAADDPGRKDLARNGSFLVFRTLSQDVRRFWKTLVAATGGLAGARILAERMVGRTLRGQPLIAGHGDNAFTYDDDRDGRACPLGAHIRRANPRNTDFPHHETGAAQLVAALGLNHRGFRDDLVSAVRFHRVLRRGREFGSGLSPEDALLPSSRATADSERGIHFICLNANIVRQFEFIQAAWMNATGFDGLHGEQDPLLGSRHAPGGCPASSFGWRENDVPRQVSGLPQFVTMRGGAYFFLPSLRALSYLARAAWLTP